MIRRARRGHPPGHLPSLRPDHLVVWLTGFGVGPDGPILLDEELADPAFDVGDWVDRVREGYPDSALAVVHDGQGSGSPWMSRLDRVVGALRDAEGRFTGDTTPTSLSQQRAWTRSVLEPHRPTDPAGWRDRAVEDVVLVVDELVSNVEQHAHGWVTIDAVVADGAVLVAVSDPCPGQLAVPRPAAPSDPSGRGLQVVDSLALTWGMLVGRDNKTVWAWLPLVPSSDGTDDGHT